jgi:branched-chain amino acid transport system ATP-binding protein
MQTSQPTLQLLNATARLGSRVVLHGVSIEVRQGEIIALLGHNGAGKSTILRCIMGILPLHSGAIELGFASWKRDPRVLLRHGLCYLPQQDKLFTHMTVRDNLRVLADAIGLNRREFELRYDELSRLFPLLGAVRKVLAGRLSGGEAQQVALARTFLARPRLYLLDEPSIGLNPVSRKSIFATIRAATETYGASAILVEHEVKEALQISNRAYILRQGSIVITDDSAKLLRNPRQLRETII